MVFSWWVDHILWLVFYHSSYTLYICVSCYPTRLEASFGYTTVQWWDKAFFMTCFLWWEDGWWTFNSRKRWSNTSPCLFRTTWCVSKLIDLFFQFDRILRHFKALCGRWCGSSLSWIDNEKTSTYGWTQKDNQGLDYSRDVIYGTRVTGSVVHVVKGELHSFALETASFSGFPTTSIARFGKTGSIFPHFLILFECWSELVRWPFVGPSLSTLECA